MGKLIYSMITSLDGYVEDANGRFGWGAPEDEQVHAFINELGAGIHTYLYGRRMYDTMDYWETFPDTTEQQAELRAWARQWRSAQKIVFSHTLKEPRSENTHIEPAFDADAIRQLKAQSPHDLSVEGPELAAQAIRAGLVDEYQPIVCPVIVGGGKRFFPADVELDLELREARAFDGGVVVMRYGPRMLAS